MATCQGKDGQVGFVDGQHDWLMAGDGSTAICKRCDKTKIIRQAQPGMQHCISMFCSQNHRFNSVLCRSNSWFFDPESLFSACLDVLPSDLLFS